MNAPPAGAPWDLPIEVAPLSFVDLEMTGLDPSQDRIVEVCVERFVGPRCVGAVRGLVNPEGRVDRATHVHGIGSSELAAAPRFTSLASDVIGLIEGAVFVAHAAVWDVRFLSAECARAGLPLHLDHWLDTLVLARRAFAFRSHSLEALCRELRIERGRAHRAESDVKALRELFARCVAVLRPVSARDLWEVRVGDRQARHAIVEACEAAVKHGAPVVLTYRPAGRSPEPLPMVLLGVRADLDPPLVVGYQLPGRGRRQLRADRILRVDPAPASATQ